MASVFEDESYPPPQGESRVEFVHYVKRGCLRYLLEETYGRRLYSRDVPGLPDENTQKNVKNVWEALDLRVPLEFCPLAVRVQNDRACDILKNCYGPIMLVLRRQRIADSTIIVNGDFKNIGHALQETTSKAVVDSIRASAQDAEIVRKVGTWRTNAKRPRKRPYLIGQYVEARLLRAITVDDVNAVSCHGRYDPEAVRMLRRATPQSSCDGIS